MIDSFDLPKLHSCVIDGDSFKAMNSFTFCGLSC